MQTRRLTIQQRTNRICNRIQKAGAKGITIRKIARHERLSIGRTYFYLRMIRRKQRRKDGSIERLGKRLYFIKPIAKEAKEKTRRPIFTHELRGYVNYASSRYRSRDIDIDCVTLIQKTDSAIATGIRRIKDRVEWRLGYKLTSILKFGISPTTQESDEHFVFRRNGGNWIAF